jgi:hypothetical protein
MDPIAIVLKFRHGLNPTTQDRIAESGTDRLQDSDFDGWFKAARCLDLNRLVNEAFHFASRHPPAHSAPTPMMYPTLPRTPFLFLRSHPPPPRPLQQCTPLRAHYHLASLWTSTAPGHSNLSCKPATDAARLVTSVETATFSMTSTT